MSFGRAAAGWAMIGGGLLGVVLPVIPGIPLLAGGFVILAPRYRWAALSVLWARRKLRQVTARRAAAA